MGYGLEDADGNDLGPGPTITGLRLLKEFFATQDVEDYPAISEFIEFGYTAQTKLLARECRILVKLAEPVNPHIATTFRYWIKAASKAKEIIMLTM